MEAIAVAESVQEDLEHKYEESCDRIVELQNELRAAQLETEQLKMRLRSVASGGLARRAGPTAAALPSAEAPAEDLRAADLWSLLRWLAARVDLSQPEALEVGFQVPVAGRVVHFGAVVQWPVAPGNLRFSVPAECRDEVEAALRAAGPGAPGASAAEDLSGVRIAAEWELLPTLFATAPDGRPDPVVLLAHRGSTRAMIVASWPTRQALQAHTERGADRPSLGERVEVEYEGCWCRGTLHAVDVVGRASVRCDADAPGIVTVAPLSAVRQLKATHSPAAPPATFGDPVAAPEQKCRAARGEAPHRPARRGGHRRTRSAM